MKKITIIFAMLILALSVSAQTNRSSRTATSKESAKSTATKTTVEKANEANTTKSTVKPSPAVRTTNNSTTNRSSTSGSTSRTTGNVSKSSSDRVSTTTTERSGERSSSVSTGTASPNRTRTTTTTRTVQPANTSTTSRSTSTRTVPSENNGTTTRSTGTRTVPSGNTGTTNRSSGTVNNGSDNRREATTTSRTSTRVVEPVSTSRRIATPDEYKPVDRNAYSNERKVYYSYHPNRVVRTAPIVRYNVKPIEYRRVHYPYNEPVYREIYWNMNMYNEYIYLYPNYNYWYHPFGYKIQTVSAYDASSFVGDIARIYGRVYEIWYNGQNDEYYFYFGGPYPYNDFSVIVNGNDARRFNRRPERYFRNKNIVVTGLVGFYGGKPEMIIKKSSQIDIY
jgi:hypothetical protein